MKNVELKAVAESWRLCEFTNTRNNRTALTVTSTYEKNIFALFFSISLTIYGKSSLLEWLWSPTTRAGASMCADICARFHVNGERTAEKKIVTRIDD